MVSVDRRPEPTVDAEGMGTLALRLQKRTLRATQNQWHRKASARIQQSSDAPLSARVPNGGLLALTPSRHRPLPCLLWLWPPPLALK